jgi:8-oxo-dGTP pyrophosphatase MutT (NUDIX family)
MAKATKQKLWHISADGVRFPTVRNPDRDKWNNSYQQELERQFGGRDVILREHQVPVKIAIPHNRVVNHNRLDVYRRMLQAGDSVPPIVGRYESGKFRLLDGSHRLEAARQLGVKYLPAMVIEQADDKIRKAEGNEWEPSDKIALDKWLENHNVTAVSKVLSNIKNIPPDVVDHVFKTNEVGMAAVLQSPYVTPEHVSRAIRHPGATSIARTALRGPHAKEDIDWLFSPEGQREESIRTVALTSSPHVTADHIRQAAADIEPDPYTNNQLKYAIVNHKDTPTDVLKQLIGTAALDTSVRGVLFNHPNAGPVVDQVLRSDHLSGRLARAALASPHATAEHAERLLHNPEMIDTVHLAAVQHPGISTETLRQVLDRPQSPEYLKDMIRDKLSEHDPDIAHTERVQTRFGTSKLREIRDLIQASGQPALHPKELPAGDWKAGRTPNGLISADRIQQHIDKLPAITYNVSHGTWDGAQRHSREDSKVFRLNLTTDMVNKMKQAGVYGTFKNIHQASHQSAHPVTPTTIGWVRYTHGDTASRNCLDCVEGKVQPECRGCGGSGREFQWCPSCDGDGKTKVEGLGEHEVDCGECNGDGQIEFDCPDCEGFGHAALDRWDLKERGDDCRTCDGRGKIINQTDTFGTFIDEVQSDFGQDFVKIAQSQAHQAGQDPQEAGQKAAQMFPPEHVKKINDIMFAGKHPSEVLQESFHQYLRDRGHIGQPVAIHSVKSKAPISLSNPYDPPPAHFKLGYDTHPKKMGMQPGHYGEGPTEHGDEPDYAERLKNAPVWRGVVRKSEVIKASKRPLPLNIKQKVKQVQAVLTDDLRGPRYKGNPNSLAGHCYVASEALYHMLGGKATGWKPMFINHEGGPHWFIQHEATGQVLDPTAAQFETSVPYRQAVGKGFLTAQPSKRAQIVIDRVQNSGPMQKAIRDLKPGKLMFAHPSNGHDRYDYSHLLTPAQRKQGYSMTVDHHPRLGGIHVQIKDKWGGEAGQLTGRASPHAAEIDLSDLEQPHRGKGLGLAMYEAALTHAFHRVGSRGVVGDKHSSSASAVHQKLSQKHGLGYVPTPNLERLTPDGDIEDMPLSEWQKNPKGDYDARFAPYEYALKHEGESNSVPPHHEPRAVSLVVQRPDGMILLGKRQDTGKWCCPGGHVDPMEPLEHAVVRELWEETALQPLVIRKLKSANGAKGIPVHLFHVVVKGQPSSQHDPDHEFVTFRWISTLEDLPPDVELHHDPDLVMDLLGLTKPAMLEVGGPNAETQDS